ncbi:MAG: Nuclear protein SET [uncultured bacterium]|nr:MAG: Nuclear protein SET [uncultured bacterium]KKT74792.1 MAG: Nuclear protein SET [Candidatus Peregrinibacteria bacterium GW2011_GWA2_44_7]
MNHESIEIKASSHGLGVFAKKIFVKNEQILHYAGAVISSGSAQEVDEADHCLQIGPNIFLGPSGEADDYLNHSCEPNSAVIINGQNATLIALRKIIPDEEIVNDYSLTVDEAGWTMRCTCDSSKCRGTIKSFRELPKDWQAHYKAMGIVPKFILENTPPRSIP